MAGNVQSLLGEDGRVVCERCAVADGFTSRLLGLQGRRELLRDEGLLLSPSSSVHTAFMRFAIDVVFLILPALFIIVLGGPMIGLAQTLGSLA